ncbi:MAG: ParB N-terminal domain-containing protein [Candidatus Krumholzibacteriota bacterium]|nr:ParB N-terminal domain-containing protein [Candidatus Krumholzibacteriota bacterium]
MREKTENRTRRTYEKVAAGLAFTGPSAPFRLRRHLPGEKDQNEADLALIESIGVHGLIQPPLFYAPRKDRSEPYTVITGHRRIAAARAAGLNSLEALLISSPVDQSGDSPGDHAAAPVDPSFDTSAAEREGAPPEASPSPGGPFPPYPPALVRLWLEDVNSGAPLSELEKIILTQKCDALGASTWPDFPSLLSRAYGKELSPPFLKRLGGLLDLNDPVLEALHRGSISTGDLLILSGHPSIEVGEAVRLLVREKLNRRRQKEIVRLMVYLASQGEDRWTDFVSLHRRGNPPLLESLYRACYPTLRKDIERINVLIKEMRLPPVAVIQPPENLEGGSYLISIRVRDKETLLLAINRLRSAVESGAIDLLLGILRGE